VLFEKRNDFEDESLLEVTSVIRKKKKEKKKRRKVRETVVICKKTE